MTIRENFILGRAERLTSEVKVDRAGRPKQPPYAFAKARERVTTRAQLAAASFRELPPQACPQDRVVAVVTLHPRYISKSDFPEDLFRSVGLRAVGSRAATVVPENWGVRRGKEAAAVTEDVFVVGRRAAFVNWAETVSQWDERTPGADELTQVEDLRAFRALEKLRGMSGDRDEGLFEFVLQDAADRDSLDAFEAYARTLEARVVIDRRRVVRGLTFLPVYAGTDRVTELADFSLVRAARGMPRLRSSQPSARISIPPAHVTLPTDPPLLPHTRVAVFDGGLPTANVFGPWVQTFEPAPIGAADPALLQHGAQVTSAALFGPLDASTSAPRPIARVDHVRVLDVDSGHADFDYYDALDRIKQHLRAHTGVYQFINLSVGPEAHLEDDLVNPWTSELDELFAHGRVFVTVAAGNKGTLPGSLGRVQPPADAVNVLSVGATNSAGVPWSRAPYSCFGPGRSPGVVKPDGVMFGGSTTEPFLVLADGRTAELGAVTGTSFAAPAALRCALGAHAQLGNEVGPLALRALMIHRADGQRGASTEHGWGRFLADPQRLVTCDDDEALFIYQGDLPVGVHLRAPVPLPGRLSGLVTISGTLVIAPEVDPNFASAYTRSGLEVVFRPNATAFMVDADGVPAAHPKTAPFFSSTKLYSAGEYSMRRDGLKWEPCLKNSLRFQGRTLHDPAFDIYYHHRDTLARARNPQPIPYAFVVSVRAPRVKDLYNQVVRMTAGVLLPLQPRVRLSIRT